MSSKSESMNFNEQDDISKEVDVMVKLIIIQTRISYHLLDLYPYSFF